MEKHAIQYMVHARYSNYVGSNASQSLHGLAACRYGNHLAAAVLHQQAIIVCFEYHIIILKAIHRIGDN